MSFLKKHKKNLKEQYKDYILLQDMSKSAQISLEYLHPELIEKNSNENIKKSIVNPSKEIFEKTKNVLKKYIDTTEHKL